MIRDRPLRRWLLAEPTISTDEPGIERIAETAISPPHGQGIPIVDSGTLVIELNGERLTVPADLDVLELVARVSLDENAVLVRLSGKLVAVQEIRKGDELTSVYASLF